MKGRGPGAEAESGERCGKHTEQNPRVKDRVKNGAGDQVALGDCPASKELGGDEDEGEQHELDDELHGGERAEECTNEKDVDREGGREQECKRDCGASEGGDQSEEEVFFRTVLFKLFNKIETWEMLQQAIGPVCWKTFNLDRYGRILDEAFRRGIRLYSAAYIMPCPPFGAARKHRNHLVLLVRMMNERVPQKIAKARSLREVFSLLRTYPSIGAFLAYQFTIDLNYSALTSFSEMEFVVAGPGARSGIQKSFADSRGLTDDDVIRAVTEHAAKEFEQRGLAFRNLWGRPLQLIDCQNLFCEVDKYSRVAHPEVNGSSRKRIKQRFVAHARPTPQWYPPKWGLSTKLPAAGAADFVPPSRTIPQVLSLFADS